MRVSLFVGLLALFSTPLGALSVGPEHALTPRFFEPAPFLRNTPRVASNGTEFLVVWNDVRGLASEVRAARVSRDGVVLDPASIVIGSGGTRAAVASDGSKYLVAYNCTTQVLGGVCLALVDAASGSVFSAGRINGAMNPAVASDGSGFVIVYQTSHVAGGLSPETIRGVAMRLDGTLGSPFGIADAPYAPAIASNGDSYYVIYSSYGHLAGVPVTEEGVAGAHRQFSGPTGFGPVVFGWSIASNGDGYLVAWQQNTGVVEQSYTTSLQARDVLADGTLGATQTLLTSGHAWHPDVTWTGSRYLVSYTASNDRAIAPYLSADADADVRVIPYAAVEAAATVYTLAERAGREAASSGATNGNATLLVWEHVHRRGAAAIEGRLIRGGEAPSDATRAFVVSLSVTWQESVTAARINDRPVVAWSENQGELQKRRVMTARLSELGATQGRLGAPDSNRDQVRPALGGSALAWVEEDLGSAAPGRINLSFLTSLALGGPLDLGAAVPGSDVSVAAAGTTHLVVWESPERKIVALRVSPTGVMDAEPLVLSEEGASSPVVISNGQNFFVAWHAEEFGEGCGFCLPFHSLHAAVVSATGAVTRPAFEVAEADVSKPRLVSDGSTYSMLWGGLDPEGVDYRAAQTFSATGEIYGPRVPLSVDGLPVAATKTADGYLVVVANGDQLELARYDTGFRLVERAAVAGGAVSGTGAGIVRGSSPGTYLLAHQSRSVAEGVSSRVVSRYVSERPLTTRRRSAGRH